MLRLPQGACRLRTHMSLSQALAARVFTAAGGKWTTYRRMAEDAVDAALATGRVQVAHQCTTSRLKLLGAQAYKHTLHTEVTCGYCSIFFGATCVHAVYVPLRKITLSAAGSQAAAILVQPATLVAPITQTVQCTKVLRMLLVCTLQVAQHAAELLPRSPACSSATACHLAALHLVMLMHCVSFAAIEFCRWHSRQLSCCRPLQQRHSLPPGS
jgi:hypothetical protein